MKEHARRIVDQLLEAEEFDPNEYLNRLPVRFDAGELLRLLNQEASGWCMDSPEDKQAFIQWMQTHSTLFPDFDHAMNVIAANDSWCFDAPDDIVSFITAVDPRRVAESDEDVDRYLTGVVPDDATMYDLDNALASRGFQFWEYDPEKKVLVNRWVYKHGNDFWVLNPVFVLQPERDYWNLQSWRNGLLVTSQSGRLKDLMRYFDRYSKGKS